MKNISVFGYEGTQDKWTSNVHGILLGTVVIYTVKHRIMGVDILVIESIIDMLTRINPLYLIIGIIAVVVILRVVGKILKVVFVVGLIVVVLYKIGGLPIIHNIMRIINI